MAARQEADRLAAAQRYAVVDAADGLIDVLQLAGDMSAAPIVVLSLVGQDSVRLLAATGLPAAIHTARQGSFSDLVVAAEDAVVISDASADVRVADHPLVAAGPRVRHYTGVPLRMAGYTIGALAVLDVRPRPRDERAVRALRTLAARLDTEAALRQAVADTAVGDPHRYRDEVISLLTHEIRTPVTAIDGFVELLLDLPEATDRHARYADAISRNTARLCRTVDHLLNVARAETDALRDTRRRIDLVQAVTTHLADHDGRIRLVLPGRPVAVDADVQLLGRSLDNLLSNAVAHSRGAPVTVTVSADPQPTIAVTDHGVGIPADELPHVGTAFFRGTHARTHELPGIGLGLFVTRQDVNAHAGTLTVRSEPGQGTTAQITLPHPA